MKDYSAMTNDEISKSVGDLIGLNWAKLDDNYHPLCYWENASNDLLVFGPCNKPNNAWSIIVENGIGIFQHLTGDNSLTWTATTDLDKSWLGAGGEGFEYTDGNPLRAAMIVFLMMKESQ